MPFGQPMLWGGSACPAAKDRSSYQQTGDTESDKAGEEEETATRWPPPPILPWRHIQDLIAVCDAVRSYARRRVDGGECLICTLKKHQILKGMFTITGKQFLPPLLTTALLIHTVKTTFHELMETTHGPYNRFWRPLTSDALLPCWVRLIYGEQQHGRRWL